MLSVAELNRTLNQTQDCKIHTFRITQGNTNSNPWRVIDVFID